MYAMRKDSARRKTVCGSSPVTVKITRAESPKGPRFSGYSTDYYCLIESFGRFGSNISPNQTHGNFIQTTIARLGTRPRSTGDLSRNSTYTHDRSTGHNVSNDIRKPSSLQRTHSPHDSKTSHVNSGSDGKLNLLQIPASNGRRWSVDDHTSESVLTKLSNVSLKSETSGTTFQSSSRRSVSPFDFIERERLPCGSPTFQKVLYELLSESDMSKGESEDTDDDRAAVGRTNQTEKIQIKASKPRKRSLKKPKSVGTKSTQLYIRGSFPKNRTYNS